MIGGNNFISIQLRNQWTGRFWKFLFVRTDEKKNRKKIEKKIERIEKIETQKGGLITLDDDLKVNSQKVEPGKKQLWTVDPQEFFKLHQIQFSTTLSILPHRKYYTMYIPLFFKKERFGMNNENFNLVFVIFQFFLVVTSVFI